MTIATILICASLGSTREASAQSTSSGLTPAQVLSTDLFARNRGVSVRQRPRPGYDAIGLLAGVFTAYPSLQLDAEFVDNVFAVAGDAEEDVLFRIRPSVEFEAGWSRHAFSAYGRAEIVRHQEIESENHDDFGFGASGRLDVTRAATIAAGVDHARITEPRTSSNAPASSGEPIAYDFTSGYLTASRSSGRLKLSGRADLRIYDYADGVAFGGGVIDQDNRDRRVTSLTGRADHALSPATALFVQATANARDYDAATPAVSPSRDSDGYEILIGSSFELGAVARGELAMGYISQAFDAIAYDPIEGFGARARIEWFPTQLTTLTVTGSRAVEDAGLVGAGGYLSSSLGLEIDHELLRNLLLNAHLSLSQDEYEGIDRVDDRILGGIGATWLLNRRLGVSVRASRFDQSSKGAAAGSDFDIGRLTLTLAAQF